MALFELSDLDSYLGLEGSIDTARATVARDIATGLVEAVTGPLEAGTATIVLPIGNRGLIRLPMRVVTGVDSVQVAGAEANWTWMAPDPVIRLDYWSADPDITSATVTVDYGTATVPRQAWAVALSCAARAYSNPEGNRSESIDDYSVTRAGSDETLAGATLTPAELRTLSSLGGGVYVSGSQ